MAKFLLGLFLGAVSAGAGYIIIRHPGWESSVGGNSIFAFLYRRLPEPWNKRVLRGCGTVFVLLGIAIALFSIVVT